MEHDNILEELKKKGYRDTQTRRMVVSALRNAAKPVSPYDLHEWIEKNRGTMSPVTVYRILDVLEELGLVHKHPCSGKIALCEHPGKTGAHAYLHCTSCGKSDEICHDALSAAANIAARSEKFSHIQAMIELSGTCKSCS